jgi:hypothetical protein
MSSHQGRYIAAVYNQGGSGPTGSRLLHTSSEKLNVQSSEAVPRALQQAEEGKQPSAQSTTHQSSSSRTVTGMLRRMLSAAMPSAEDSTNAPQSPLVSTQRLSGPQQFPLPAQGPVRSPLQPLRSLGQTFCRLLGFATMSVSPDDSARPRPIAPMPELTTQDMSWAGWLERTESAWNPEADARGLGTHHRFAAARMTGPKVPTNAPHMPAVEHPSRSGPVDTTSPRTQFAASGSDRSHAPALCFATSINEGCHPSSESSSTGSDSSADMRYWHAFLMMPVHFARTK